MDSIFKSNHDFVSVHDIYLTQNKSNTLEHVCTKIVRLNWMAHNIQSEARQTRPNFAFYPPRFFCGSISNMNVMTFSSVCVYLCLSMCTNNHNSEQFIKSIPRYHHHHRYLLLCYTKSTPIFFYGTDFHIQRAENVHENGVNKSLLELPTTGRYTQQSYIPYSCSVITKGQIDKQKSRRYKPHK